MALGVMFLNMFKLRRVAECGDAPIQIPHPLVQRRVAGANVSEIAFEMLDVDRIEADDGGVQADVCFGDLVAKVKWRALLA